MDINDLNKIFKQATDTNTDVCIELTIPNRKSHEFIIILNDNLDYKLDYYTKNYTEDLILNRCADIKIVNAFAFVFGKSDKYNL